VIGRWDSWVNRHGVGRYLQGTRASPTAVAAARKHKALIRRALAEHVGIHVSQIRRYEAGNSQPTLDVLRNLALALSVSTDALVFAETDRGPSDEPRLAFEATTRLDPDEQTMVRTLIEAVLLKHEAKRWAS
jgi:transcriptional regulator with XRE-family HTH domain